ncbi:hypothetical protein PoHVEF18_008558 [Penicillium ochrochloron]
MELHVKFESDGESLAGVHFRPENAQGKLPTVVCADGGGYVLILAAIDPRIKSVVSIVPVVDGFNNLRRAHDERRFVDIQAATMQHRRDRVVGKEGKITMASQTPYEELSVWPFPRVNGVFMQVKESEVPLPQESATQ